MFNYFLPNLTKAKLAPSDRLDRALLLAAGLGTVLSDVEDVPAHASVIDLNCGPNGKSGVLIVPVRKASGVPHVTFDPNVQRWQQRGKTDVWFGAVSSDAIRTGDLERPAVVGGADVRDAAGNVWICPICRAPHLGYEFGSLRQGYTFDDAGEPQAHLAAEDLWMWELATSISDWYADECNSQPDDESDEGAPARPPGKRPPLSQLAKYAAQLLAVNYRLDHAEINFLHQHFNLSLLTQLTIHGICRAAIGWELLAEATKKKPSPTEKDTVSSPPPSSPSSTTGEGTPGDVPGTGRATEP